MLCWSYMHKVSQLRKTPNSYIMGTQFFYIYIDLRKAFDNINQNVKCINLNTDAIKVLDPKILIESRCPLPTCIYTEIPLKLLCSRS